MTYADEVIRRAVVDRLARDDRIDDANIVVQVSEGVVTLRGTVNSRQEKDIAAEDAKAIRGARKVMNHIEAIKGNKEPARSSGEIRGGSVRPGMEVFGSDGEFVGRVKAVYNRQFQVDRIIGVDLLIPFSAAWCQSGCVVLDVYEDDVHKQGWRTPEW